MTELDLEQLRTLAVAVSEGTFDAAARTLHVTPSAVSQRIKALESTVGRVLLIRAKPIRPTESGEILLRAARQIDTITADAIGELGDGDGASASSVALAASADSLDTWLIPALAPLGGEVMIDLRREDESRTAELLRDGSVMAAVSADARPVAGCLVEPLGAIRYRAVATPTFVERWLPAGGSVAELTQAPMVCFDRADDLQERYLRRRTRRQLDPPRHFVPSATGFLIAVESGLGWGMVPDLQLRPASVAIEFDPRGSVDIRLYWHQWRLRSTALRRVADAVQSHAATVLI